MKQKRDELLSHEADGIHEFDNALPRWWLYIFYFTIGFAVVYLVNYHVLPTPLVGRAGLVAEYQADVARAASLAPVSSGGPTMLRALTDQASLEKGRAVFEGDTNVCASCHRPDLGGLVGPNLTDDYWLHGCSPAEIANSIRTGYPQKGMMPFGTGQRLSDEQVLQVTSYILSKHDSHPAAPKAIDPARDQRCNGGRREGNDDH